MRWRCTLRRCGCGGISRAFRTRSCAPDGRAGWTRPRRWWRRARRGQKKCAPTHRAERRTRATEFARCFDRRGSGPAPMSRSGRLGQVSGAERMRGACGQVGHVFENIKRVVTHVVLFHFFAQELFGELALFDAFLDQAPEEVFLVLVGM